MMRAWCGLVLVFLLAGAAAPRGAGDDVLSNVRALYASASYEEALATLNRATDSSADPVQVDTYRAMCLIALNRRDDAEQALERIVERKPAYLLDESEVSPRVVSLFLEVRQRALPTALQKLYRDAKQDFDGGRYPHASAGFQQVVDLIGQVDTKEQGTMVTDLKELSEGFLKLSNAAIAAAAAKEKEASAAAAPVAAPPKPTRQIFGPGDADVTPPVVITQTMPRWTPPSGGLALTLHGKIEVLIDESGSVTSAAIVQPVYPMYDAELLAAAKHWRYQPAMRNGEPVKYRRAIAVVLHPPN